MVAVPFFYFLILFLILYSRVRKIDLACYTVLIYLVSAFFSILVDFYGLRSFDTQYYNISFGATFTYCALLTLTLIPIALYSNSRIKVIQPIKNEKLLRIIAWAVAVYFVFFFLMSLSSIIQVLSGDMNELRNEIYRGEASDGWMARLSPMVRLPLSLINMVLGCPWILMMLAFFCIVIQKMPLKFGVFFFMGSLLGPVNSIMGVDRSGIAYWLISLGACFLVFAPFMKKSQVRKVSVALGVLVAFALLYLTTLTESRFEDSDGGKLSGSISSLVYYFGQTFIHFCYYFDNFETPYPSLQIVFPFICTYFIGGAFQNSVSLQAYLTLVTGKQLGVFYAFIGHISTTAGNTAMVIYCFAIFVVSLLLLRRKNKHVCNLKQLILYMTFSSMLFLGLFAHYYSSPTKTFSVVAFLVISHYLMKIPSEKKKY